MTELHQRQPGFTYIASGPFTKHRKRIQKLRETGNLNNEYIYNNELDKACFAHDAAYSYTNDLTEASISGKTLKHRAYETALNPTFDGYQRELVSMLYKFFDRKTGLGAKASVNEKLKLYHNLLKIKGTNIYFVSFMFSPDMLGSNL